jgi:hypothetical protein
MSFMKYTSVVVVLFASSLLLADEEYRGKFTPDADYVLSGQLREDIGPLPPMPYRYLTEQDGFDASALSSVPPAGVHPGARPLPASKQCHTSVTSYTERIPAPKPFGASLSTPVDGLARVRIWNDTRPSACLSTMLWFGPQPFQLRDSRIDHLLAANVPDAITLDRRSIATAFDGALRGDVATDDALAVLAGELHNECLHGRAASLDPDAEVGEQLVRIRADRNITDPNDVYFRRMRALAGLLHFIARDDPLIPV